MTPRSIISSDGNDWELPEPLFIIAVKDENNNSQSMTRMEDSMNVGHAIIAIGSAALLSLAACGETRTDRALSGGAIGAGVGAAGGALTGGSAVGGALIGGAAGAATGALTDKKQLDLGKPAWER